MHIAVDCNMSELLIELTKYEGIKEAYQISDKISGLNFMKDAKVSAVIVSDQLFNEGQIKELMENNRKTTTFYHVTKEASVDRMKRANVFCSTYGVILLPPYLDQDGMAKEILAKLFPCEYQTVKENVYTFMATHSDVGATSIVHSVAQAIAEGTNKRVAVLHLNPYNEGLLDKDRGKSLDEIYNHLKSPNNTFSNIYPFFTKYKNFWVLQGNKDLKRIYEYNPKHIKKLIEIVKEEMDIVLIDAGPYFDNALSLEAVANGNFHYVVGTQQYKTISSFMKYFEQILKPLGFKQSSFSFIGNKVKSNQASIRTVAKNIGVPLLIEIPFIENTIELEQQETLLLDNKTTRAKIVNMAQGITPLTENITKEIEKSTGFSILQLIGMSK